MLPQEYSVKKILPSLRAILSHKLKDRGLSQQRIADLIMVTQPMVNKYLRTPKELFENLLIEEGVPRDVLESVTDDLVSLALRKDDIRLELINSLNIITLNTYFCKDPSSWASKICDEVLCLHLRPEISLVKAVIDELIKTKGFENLVPEVGSNIVYDPLGSGDIRKMVAVDGRIVKGSRGIYVAGDVKIGGSRHTAKILSLVRNLCSDFRSALVIKNEEEIRKSIELCGFRYLETGPHSRKTSMEKEIFSSLKSIDEPCKLDVILDRGGEGIEPVGYLLADSLDDLINKVRCILKKLMKSYGPAAGIRTPDHPVPTRPGR